jgi:HEAT repeat protein
MPGDLVADLSGDAAPSDATLFELSGLGPEELATVEAGWARLAPERQRDVVRRLVELAEADVQLDFTAILKGLLDSPDPEVRRHAIAGLWECEEASLVARLIRFLTDEAPEVRAEAVVALGRFAVLAEDGRLLAEQTNLLATSLLETAADDDQPAEVRCRALEAMAPLSEPEVSQAISAAYHGSHPALSLSALTAMGKSCDPSWIPTLTDELSSADADLRREAALALGEIEEEQSAADLAELIYDEDAAVRLAAIRALGEIGGAEAREALEQCLEDPNETVCQAAEEALGGIDTTGEPDDEWAGAGA